MEDTSELVGLKRTAGYTGGPYDAVGCRDVIEQLRGRMSLRVVKQRCSQRAMSTHLEGDDADCVGSSKHRGASTALRDALLSTLRVIICIIPKAQQGQERTCPSSRMPP